MYVYFISYLNQLKLDVRILSVRKSHVCSKKVVTQMDVRIVFAPGYLLNLLKLHLYVKPFSITICHQNMSDSKQDILLLQPDNFLKLC